MAEKKIRPFGYDLEGKDTPDLKKKFDLFLTGKLKPSQKQPWQTQDYISIISQAKRVATDPDLKNEMAKLRAAKFLEDTPAVDTPSTQYLNPLQQMQLSDFEKYRIVNIFNIISDPYYIFDLMIYNQNGRTDTEILQNYFPELFEEFLKAALEALSDFTVKHREKIIPGPAAYQMATILGVDNISAKTIAKIQLNFSETKQEQQKGTAKKKSARVDINPASLATENTKVAYGLNSKT